MKVKIIEDNCIGCGACQAICSDVFEIEDGVSRVINNDITKELEESVLEAIESCPTEAIKKEEI